MTSMSQTAPDGAVSRRDVVDHAIGDEDSGPGAVLILPGFMQPLVRVVEIVMVALLCSNVALVFAVTILRYVFDVGVTWSPEMTKLLLAGLVFPGSAVAFLRGEHRSLRLALDVLPDRVAYTLDSVTLGMISLFGGALTYGAWQWLSTATGTMLGTQVPLDLMAWPLIVGGLLLTSFAVAILAARGARQTLAGTIGGVGLALLVVLAPPALGFHGMDNLETAFLFWGAVLVVLLLGGMPIAFCFGITAIALGWGTDGLIPISGIARRLTGNSSEFVLAAVPFFIAAGLLMEAGDMTRRIIALAHSFIGHIRGGMGHVMVGSMYFMSGVTGSEAADVAAVGTVMRRPMLEAGFKGPETTGILVASSVMGASVPPSIGLIVMAASTTLSVGTLFMAGILPAIVLAVVLAVAVYIRARWQGIQGSAKASWRDRSRALTASLFAMGLPLIIIGGLTVGFGTPTELSAVAVIYVLIIELIVHRQLSLPKLWRVFVDTSVLTGMLLFIVASASALVYVSTFALIPQRVGTFLADVAGSNATMYLFLTVLALIPLGMLTEGLPALLIFPPLFLPPAELLGINPFHYAMLMFIAVYIGANMPPLGAGYYFAASVVKIPIKSGMVPAASYLGIVTIGLCLLVLLPQTVLLIPEMAGLIK